MTMVLVVDDDRTFRTMIVRDLSRNGLDVREASSVAEAEALLRQERVDVLLTDLRMAEHDGIDLMARTRSLSPHTKAVLMSGYASARDYKTALELGAVTVLCKPFSPSELLAAIKQAEECAVGYHGTLHGISLIDVLQLFHLAKRSVTVTVGGSAGGVIHMRQGEVVGAKQGQRTGRGALLKLLAGSGGAVSTATLNGHEVTIDEGFDALLLDALRELDEGGVGHDDDASESTEPDDRQLGELARATWALVAATFGQTDCVAVAFTPRGPCSWALSPGARAEPWVSIGRNTLALAESAADDKNLCFVGLAEGFSVGLVSCHETGLAFALFARPARGAATVRFRSIVSTLARSVLRREDEPQR